MNARAPMVAFYAPMKGPDHPVPSGDRTVARLYVAALRAAGFTVEITSDFRSYDGAGDADLQADLVRAAGQERQRIAAMWAARQQSPDLWFTYHLYHKAPDLLGPDLSRSLQIPYAVAEPSHAPKRATGPWADFFQRAEVGIRQADAVFVVTEADGVCVAPLRTGLGMTRLAPFIDASGWTVQRREQRLTGPLRLITVAMMRAGDKLHSYALLAEALALLPRAPFTLDIIGDGPVRAEVEALFAGLQDRVRFHGEVSDRALLSQHLAEADLFVWPAVNEAYGMALLEAQLHGLPVLAGREGGVADVMRVGITGHLVEPRNPVAFADQIMRMMADAPGCERMGQAARDFVVSERLVAQAGAILRRDLWPLMKGFQP